MNYDKQVEMEWKYGASHKNILGHINVTEMIQTAGHSQMDQKWTLCSRCSCSIMSEISQLGFFINLIVHLWVLRVLPEISCTFFFARNQSQDQLLDSGGSTAWKWDVQASGHHHDRKTNEKKDAVFVFPKDPSVGSRSHGWCWQPLHDPGSSWTKLTEMGH